NVDIHRQKLVDALHHGVDVVHASGIGAGAHGNHPFGLQHLLVQALDHGGHLHKHGTGNHHEVRLTGRGANDLCAEAGNVMGGGEGGGHFHVAAGQAKVIRPEGVLAPPVHRRVQYGFQFAHEDAAMDLLLHG